MLIYRGGQLSIDNDNKAWQLVAPRSDQFTGVLCFCLATQIHAKQAIFRGRLINVAKISWFQTKTHFTQEDFQFNILKLQIAEPFQTGSNRRLILGKFLSFLCVCHLAADLKRLIQSKTTCFVLACFVFCVDFYLTLIKIAINNNESQLLLGENQCQQENSVFSFKFCQLFKPAARWHMHKNDNNLPRINRRFEPVWDGSVT